MSLMRLFIFFCLFVLSLPTLAQPPAGHPAMPNTANRIHGKVVETMDAGNYTYVRVSDGKKEYWAAGPRTSVKKGDMIAFSSSMPFKAFHSKALNRDFAVIYFVNQLITDKPNQKPVSNPHAKAVSDPHAGITQPAGETVSGIKKAHKGKTVAEIFAQRDKLSGKQVSVRGKVIKYTAKVMGRNWLHIQDGSHNKQLTVTTKKEVKKGDVVLVKGKLALNRDLGFGYVYEVVLEDASIKVE